MQEEVNQRAIALVTRAGKITGSTLFKLLRAYLQHIKKQQLQPNIPQGKQTVKQLAKQGQGMTSLDMNDKDIRLFAKVMRKYGVDYAVMKDKKTNPPTYTIFFKGKDADAVTKAFTEFTTEITKKATRPSVLEKLKSLIEKVKNSVVDKVKYKEQSR